MSPSFSSEGKTVLVWVKVLPFLCCRFSTVLGSSPWIIHFWKTMAAFDQGSYWTLDKPNNYTANKDEQNKLCHGCPIPWGSRVGTGTCLAQPGGIWAASKAASGCFPPESKPPSWSLCPSHYCYQTFPTTKHLHVSPCHELFLTGLLLTQR